MRRTTADGKSAINGRSDGERTYQWEEDGLQVPDGEQEHCVRMVGEKGRSSERRQDENLKIEEPRTSRVYGDHTERRQQRSGCTTHCWSSYRYEESIKVGAHVRMYFGCGSCSVFNHLRRQWNRSVR